MKNSYQADDLQGVVKGLSHNRQRVAVFTDYGYTVFDLVRGEVDLHDVVSGDLDTHGGVDLTNLTTGRTLSVHIEAIQATPAAVQTLLSRR